MSGLYPEEPLVCNQYSELQMDRLDSDYLKRSENVLRDIETLNIPSDVKSLKCEGGYPYGSGLNSLSNDVSPKNVFDFHLMKTELESSLNYCDEPSDNDTPVSDVAGLMPPMSLSDSQMRVLRAISEVGQSSHEPTYIY